MDNIINEASQGKYVLHIYNNSNPKFSTEQGGFFKESVLMPVSGLKSPVSPLVTARLLIIAIMDIASKTQLH